MERDENTQRQDLLDFETSKQRLAQIHQIEVKLKAKATSVPSRDEKRSHRKTGKKPDGRPKKSGSARSTEEATGTPKATHARLEEHVRLAERIPFLRGPSSRRTWSTVGLHSNITVGDPGW